MSGRAKPEITARRSADENHDVVTVVGGRGSYRRQPCGGPQSTPERPGCPWRVDATGSFPRGAFAISASTADDMARNTFACHESGTQNPSICAGFLLRGAEHNMTVRLKLGRGIDPDQISDGGHELHPGYVTMAIANGVPPDHEALENCRLSSWEEELR